MAFISMVFASVALIVVIIGIAALFIGVILDLIWIIRACMKKKTHILVIIPAVIFTLAGILMFVVPVGGVYSLGKYSTIKEEKHFEQTENKAYVKSSSWVNGFEYKDMMLIPLEDLQIPKSERCTEDGVVITKGDNKYYISYVENDGDFEIYYVEKITHGIFCDEEQYDEILEFYHDTNNLNVTFENWTDDTIIESDDFDANIVFDIRELYDTHGDGIVYGDYGDVGNRYLIKAVSLDGLMYESVNVEEYNERLVLMWTSGGESFSAIYLPEELENKVREMIE